MGLETSRGLLDVEPGLERPKSMLFVNGSEEEALDVKDRSLKQADTLLCCQVVSLRRGISSGRSISDISMSASTFCGEETGAFHGRA